MEGRTRFGEGTRPTIYFAILAAVLTLPAVLLLAFPDRALADADLSINKQGPSRVEPLEQFDYVLTVSNGRARMRPTMSRSRTTLPSGVMFDGYEAPAGVSCILAADTVTCTVPTLAAGESKTITLRVTAPANVGVIENKATASAAEDPDSPVTSNKVTTTVAPNLVIEKLDDPDPVRHRRCPSLHPQGSEPGRHGPANGVTVTDELPLDMVDFVTVDSADFDCQYKAGIVKCYEDHPLAPGEIAKVEIVVEPEKAGTIQNTGAVFVQGISKALDTDTETTIVNGGGGGNGGGGNGRTAALAETCPRETSARPWWRREPRTRRGDIRHHAGGRNVHEHLQRHASVADSLRHQLGGRLPEHHGDPQGRGERRSWTRR